MTHVPAGALAALMICSFPFGAAPARATPSLAAARVPLVEARTSCDENGRCYETGDPGAGDDDRAERRRYDRDDEPPPERRRYEDPDDRGPPPRDYDRDAAPRAPYRGDRRRNDDDEEPVVARTSVSGR